jgi:hypothetical protein
MVSPPVLVNLQANGVKESWRNNALLCQSSMEESPHGRYMNAMAE